MSGAAGVEAAVWTKLGVAADSNAARVEEGAVFIYKGVFANLDSEAHIAVEWYRDGRALRHLGDKLAEQCRELGVTTGHRVEFYEQLFAAGKGSLYLWGVEVVELSV